MSYKKRQYHELCKRLPLTNTDTCTYTEINYYYYYYYLKIADFTCEKCPDSQNPEEGDDRLAEGCEFMKDLWNRFDNNINTDEIPKTLKALESDEIEDAIRDKLGVEPEVFKECMEDMEKKRKMFSKKLKEEVCKTMYVSEINVE